MQTVRGRGGVGEEEGIREGGGEGGEGGGVRRGVAWSMYEMHIVDGTVIAQSESGVCNMYPTNLLFSMSTA